MLSLEENYDDWKEIRGRVDSLASAIFLIAGGALTLSITVLLNTKTPNALSATLKPEIELSWYLLLGALVAFVLLKAHLILQAFMRNVMSAKRFNAGLVVVNTVGWVLGLSGLGAFFMGMYLLVKVAVAIIFST